MMWTPLILLCSDTLSYCENWAVPKWTQAPNDVAIIVDVQLNKHWFCTIENYNDSKFVVFQLKNPFLACAM